MSLRLVLIAGCFAFCIASFSARSQSGGITAHNVQILAGTQFDDRLTGAFTPNGNLLTFSAEGLYVRDWGDQFWFVDVNVGELLDFAGQRRNTSAQAYGEWHPRLSVWRSASDSGLSQIFLAGQLNASDNGFHAGLIGLGADFKVPGLYSLGSNLYLRDDNFNRHTWQSTTFWLSAPLLVPTGSGKWYSEGFIDISGTDTDGSDIVAQPRLLYAYNPVLSVGFEWYYHRNRSVHTSAPQLMLKVSL